MTRILFVCSGNTCRSAMAEFIFRSFVKKSGLKSVEVSSAGLDVTEKEMNQLAKTALLKLDIKAKKFVPKQINAEIVLNQDAVICMTEQLKARFVDFDNVYSFNELTKLGDVSDPFGQTQNSYDKTAEVLFDGCKMIVEIIKSKGE